MPKITYKTEDDKIYTIDVQNGLTVMEGAIQNENIVILKCLKIDLVLFYLLAQFR